jgi:hypothetical protein
MNKYRQAMIHLRELNAEHAKICTDCAGWSSFGGTNTPMYIAVHGEICICTPHWTKLEKIIKELEPYKVKQNNSK